MSCFIVSKKTISRVVRAMLPSGRRCEDGDALGQRLMEMNRAAYMARYKVLAGHSTVPTDEQIAEYRYDPVEPTRMQMYVALSCLHYQCSEELPPNGFMHALYEQLGKARDAAAREYIAATPDYDDVSKSEWL